MKELARFLDSNLSNSYIYCERFTLYVRKGYHNIHGLGSMRTFDIGSISLQEKLRGQGRFGVLLDHIEETVRASKCGYRIIYIESVMNKGFLAKLHLMGFQSANPSQDTPGCSTVYRIIEGAL